MYSAHRINFSSSNIGWLCSLFVPLCVSTSFSTQIFLYRCSFFVVCAVKRILMWPELNKTGYFDTLDSHSDLRHIVSTQFPHLIIIDFNRNLFHFLNGPPWAHLTSFMQKVFCCYLVLVFVRLSSILSKVLIKKSKKRFNVLKCFVSRKSRAISKCLTHNIMEDAINDILLMFDAINI